MQSMIFYKVNICNISSTIRMKSKLSSIAYMQLKISIPDCVLSKLSSNAFLQRSALQICIRWRCHAIINYMNKVATVTDYVNVVKSIINYLYGVETISNAFIFIKSGKL